MSRRLLIALAVAAVAVTAVAGALVLLAHDFEPYGAAEKVAQVAIGGIWILAGLIAWQRRPGNPVGPLMTAIGFGQLAPFLYWDAALPFTLAALVYWLALPVTLHLFLAFPSGHLATRVERDFVAFAYAAVVLGSLISQLFADPSVDCPDCPRNLLLVHSDSGVWSVVSIAGDVLLIAILLPAVVLIVRHVRGASGR